MNTITLKKKQKLVDFLEENNYKDKFMNNMLTPIENLLRVNEHLYIVCAFDWSITDENKYFWKGVNKKWRKYIKSNN